MVHLKPKPPSPQCPAVTVIRFNNLLSEAAHAFRASDFRKSEELLAEARVMVAFERRLLGEAV